MPGSQMAIRMVVAGLAIAGFAFAGPAGRGARADDEPAAPDCAALFGWFEGLRSYESPQDRPWVRVYTGQWTSYGDEPPAQVPRTGFLLEEEGATFRVLFTDLSVGRFERTPAGTAEHERVDFEGLDPVDEIDTALQRLRAPSEDGGDHWRRFGARVEESTEVFVLAVAAHAHGLEDRAAALCAEAGRLARKQREEDPVDLRAALATDLAHARMWQLVVAFGGDDFLGGRAQGEALASRRVLLGWFRDLRSDFPDSAYAERVTRTIALLEKMVAEDEAHAAQPQRAWASLARDEQVAELIYELRDQNGHQWSQPGWCDIFADERGEESPAERLVAMGFDAVPQLIEILDDDRFTRSVGFHRDFYFSHHVLRVGDCAQAILSRIAGRNFWSPQSTSSTMRSDGETSSVKVAARAWWEEVSAKGEAAVLEEGVRAGGRDAIGQAERLVERYPERATAALAAGIAHTSEDWARVALIEQLGHVPGEAPVDPLLAELRDGPGLPSRVAAARALQARERPEALAAMLAALQEPGMRKVGSGLSELVQFLLQCGNVGAVEALSDALPSLPFQVRYSAITTLNSSTTRSELVVGGGAEGAHGSGSGAAGTPAWDTAAQALLVGLLHDAERYQGMSGSWNGVSFSDPRLQDLAAYVLSLRWPDRYVFDLGASEGARDRQRVVLENVWRAERDLEPLTVPEPRIVARTPEAELTPLLDAAVGDDGAAAAQAAAAVEALGLAALPGLLARATALPDDHPRRQGLSALASRIGARVTALDVTGPQPEPDTPLARAIDALRDAPLTADGVVAVLLESVRALPAASRGVELEALREPDLTGVTVRIAFAPGEPRPHENGAGWEHSARVEAGRRALQGSYGSSALSYLRDERAWEEARRSIAEALAFPPDRALTLRFKLEQRR